MRICIILLCIIGFSNCTTCKKKKLKANQTTNPVTIKAPAPISPTIIFGKYCGRCIGNCATMYKVGASAMDVTVDNSSNFTRKGKDSLQFTDLLTETDCYTAQQIRDIIPAEMLNFNDTTFGCPDCADQCGYFLQIINAETGEVKTYNIDTQKSALPAWLKEFPSQVNEILKQLKKPTIED